MPEQLANLVGVGLEWIVAVFGGLMVAFWVGMIVWTWRDIRSRSADIFAALLALILVALFNDVGVLLYPLLRPKHTLAEQYDRALEEEALLREIEQAKSCQKCGRPVELGWQYCPYCETELRHPCAQCNHLLEPEWKRCPHCGSYPGRSAQPAPALAQVAPAALPMSGTVPVPPPAVAPTAEELRVEDSAQPALSGQ